MRVISSPLPDEWSMCDLNTGSTCLLYYLSCQKDGVMRVVVVAKDWKRV